MTNPVVKTFLVLAFYYHLFKILKNKFNIDDNTLRIIIVLVGLLTTTVYYFLFIF